MNPAGIKKRAVRKRTSGILWMMMAGLLFLFSCQDSWEERFQESPDANQSVWETLTGRSDFAGFVSLLESAGLDSLLQRNSVYTVFVPEASALDPLASLPAGELQQLLMYHISNAVVYTGDVKEGILPVRSLLGKQLFLDRDGGGVRLNQDSHISEADIRASNGVIHVIDEVQQIRPNLISIIETEEKFSSLKEYILSGSEVYFDEENSIPVDIDSIGRTIYDSVWIYTNDFFTNVADLSSEDETYTVFLADDVLLDTTEGGDYKEGYISSFARFVVPGLYAPEDLPASLASAGGEQLDLPADKFEFYEHASNGIVYKLSSLSDIRIPVSVIWEFTDIPEFDSIRGIRTTDYLPYYESLQTLRVSDLEGWFTEFAYELKSGTLHGDYLKIGTGGGTYVTLEMDVPSLLPGKYRILVNATIRAADGVTFDTFLNGIQVSQGSNFNGGVYSFEEREIGIIDITAEGKNVFRMDLDGSNSVHTKCYIDYLKFEPAR